MIPDLLTNLEIQKYGQNEPRFNDVYLRDNSLDKIKDGTYVIDLDQYANIGSDWIALYTKDNTITFFFGKFGIEHISKEIKKFINGSTIITNIFRIQVYDSVICGYFCIGFIDFKPLKP